MHVRRGQEGISLLAHDGHEVVQRTGAVFALEGRVVAQVAGDMLGLIDHAGADRAGVDLDQAHDFGLFGADEVGDAVQDLAVAPEIAGARKGEVERGTGAGGVTDVIDEKSQLAWVLGAKRAFYTGRGPVAGASKTSHPVAARCQGPEFRYARPCDRLPALHLLGFSGASRCLRPIQFASSLPTSGRTRTTICACSNTWKAHAISSTAISVPRTVFRAATRKRCARSCAGR